LTLHATGFYDRPKARDRDALVIGKFCLELGLSVLIAIPVFNERKYVEHVLAKVRRFHDQILLVDDGSTDGTADYLAGRSDIYLIRHPENRGYGQSLIDAFAFADARGFDWVITMDCDEQHEPERIPDFMRAIESDRWDLISGSRYMMQMPANDLPPNDRRSINVFITSTLNDCYHLNLTDAFCGFKAHRMSAMRRLKLDIPGYAFPMQLWPQVVHHKLRVTEIPVRLIYNDPNRHFGGLLDDPDNRLRHYLDVLCKEQKWIDASAGAGKTKRVPCPCN
jgi:glycosyltransferase involved in cell wall biosynthesis